MKQVCIFVCGVFLFAVMVWVLLTYILISDETRIQRAIEKGRLCIEEGSILPFGNLLSAQYQDVSGADRAIAMQVLKSLFDETRERKIHLISVNVRIDGDKADAVVQYRFQFKGKSSSPQLQRLIDEASQETQSMRVQFQKEKKTWRIVHTDRD